MKTNSSVMAKKPLIGRKIYFKTVNDKKYKYQIESSGRDPRTGKVWKVERYLGPVDPVKTVPIMDRLSDAEKRKVIQKYVNGEDVDLIRARIAIYAGADPSRTVVYRWVKSQGLTRAQRCDRTERSRPQRMLEKKRRQGQKI